MDEKSSYEGLEKKIKELKKEIDDLSLSKQRSGEKEKLEKFIADHKHVREILQQSEEKFRSLIEDTNDWVWEVDREGVYTYSNPKVKDLLGYSQEELIGKTPFDLMPSEEAERVADVFYDYTSSHRPFEFLENTNLHKEGHPVVMETSGVPLFDVEGEFIGYRGIDRDITKRKKAEKALIESERKWRNVLENTPQIGISLDSDARIVFANEHFLLLTGWKKQDVIGQDWFDMFIPENVRDSVRKVFSRVMAQKDTHGFSNYENEIQSRDGELINVAWSNVLTKDGSGNIVDVTCLGVDLTERQRSEKTLRESEEYMQSIFRAAPTGIGVVHDRILIKVNDRFCEMLGYSRDDLVGQPSRMVYPSQEEFEKVGREKYKQIQKKGTGTVETLFKRKDGKTINVLLSSTPINRNDLSAGVTFTALDITELKQIEKSLIQSESKYRIMMEAIKDPVYICSQNFHVEYMNPTMVQRIGYDATGELCYKALHNLDQKCQWCKHDESLRIGHYVNEIVSPMDNRSYHISSSIFSNADGSLSKISVFRDNTEMNRIQEQLQQAQKMEAIGTLAGGIAHDFNNILLPIMMHSELAMMELATDNPVQSNLKQIFHAGERARDLVKQILTFARKREGERILIGVSGILKETVKFLRASIPSTIDIQCNISSGNDIVFADPIHLNQIIMNLCTNASHAMEDRGGVLEITLETLSLVDESLAQSQGLQEDSYIRLTVKDTGQGIDQKIKANIFEPYFTTKDIGKGTGMGLALVHSIVKGYDGAITVQSEVGKGTAFHIYLPLVEGDVATQDTVKDSVQYLTGSERILFVDDEIGVVDAVGQMLELFGYKVTVRTSSIEALEAFRHNPQGFDLIISDMTMPNMTGKELCTEILSIRPDIPVIMCTGFSEKIDEKRANDIGIKAFVMKPIVMNEMANTIRGVLDKKAGR